MRRLSRLSGRGRGAQGDDILINALAARAAHRSMDLHLCRRRNIAHFEALARQRGLADRVHFWGWVDAEEVHRWRPTAMSSCCRCAPRRCRWLAEGAAGAVLVATSSGKFPKSSRPASMDFRSYSDPVALGGALDRLIAGGTEWLVCKLQRVKSIARN